MGIIFGLIATGLLIYGVYALIHLPDERAKLLAEFRKDRLGSIAVLVWGGFLMMFLWGLLVPPLGRFQIHLGAVQLALWQVGGLGSLAGLIIGLVWEWARDR